MRNLNDYPITLGEAYQVLEIAAMRLEDDDRIGGIDSLVMQQILDLFKYRFTDEDFKHL